jgi:glutathione-specific gamma-glutamylcyclotransferase
LSDTVPVIPASIESDPAGEAFWVFAYGSLMWRPDFDFVERVPALLRGVHRALCVASTRYRGTPAKPGVVLGLDHGGSCQGIAFRVAPDKIASTRAYLTEREMVNRVYHEVMRPVRLADGRRVTALAYVVDRTHRQYVRGLDRAQLVTLILQGHGLGGPCRDYVLNTLASLADLGIEDHALSWLVAALRDEPSPP